MRKYGSRVLIGLIFTLGICLRIYKLGIVPGGYQMDEAYSAWIAYSLFHSGIDSAGYSYPVYFEAWGHGMNALNSYLMLPFLALNGGHISLVIARLPQVLTSVSSLFAVYFVSKKMFSQNFAKWALFVTAICPWHVMMTRWGLESDLAPGFLILGFCFWIYSFEKRGFLIPAALCYGLSLYCYATIWPMLPVLLSLQMIYTLWNQKLKIDGWLFGFVAILGILAFPLVCFLMVNMGYMEGFEIGPFSVYRMTLFRGNELAHSFADIMVNVKNLLSIFYHQDGGRPYDVIAPYGFFYRSGSILILVGILFVLKDVIVSIRKHEFTYSFYILFQLVTATLVGCLINVNMTQINCIYLPLLMCEAMGIYRLVVWVKRWNEKAAFGASVLLSVLFLSLTVLFQIDYYTEYKELTSAYFQQGTEEGVQYAFSLAKEQNREIYINDAIKYPNVLLYTQTTGEEYISSKVDSNHLPAPASFVKDGVTFHMGFDSQNIEVNQIYIIYYVEADLFGSHDLIPFYDWYVAVPKTDIK